MGRANYQQICTISYAIVLGHYYDYPESSENANKPRSSRFTWSLLMWYCLALGSALQYRFAGKVDPALFIDLGYLDLYLVANIDHIFDLGYPFFG